MNISEKKALYESIIKDVAKIVKKRLNEADQDSYYKEIDGLKNSVFDARKIAKFFEGGKVSAYNPSVKGNSDSKDWQMYAVRISDIKNAQCIYYGNLSKFGIPNYLNSRIVLYGRISYIKAGNGQNWEQEFVGKLVISYNSNSHTLFFEPW